jgi:hypothetical protein
MCEKDCFLGHLEILLKFTARSVWASTCIFTFFAENESGRKKRSIGRYCNIQNHVQTMLL